MQEPCLPIKDPEDHVANLSSQGQSNPQHHPKKNRHIAASLSLVAYLGRHIHNSRTTPAQTWCTRSRVYPFDTSSSHSSYHLTCLNHVQAVYYAVLCRPFACDLSTLNAQGPGHASVLHCSPSKQEVLLTGPSAVECHILDAVWSEPPPSL